ncbi:hypothetical protein ACOMHN_053816 [Nucella lapillus]
MSSNVNDDTTTTTGTTTTDTTTTSSLLDYLSVGTLLVGVAVFLASLYLFKHFRAERPPPGPRGFPLLGYLPVLKAADKRQLFAELRQNYGDIFSFTLGCRLVVVVNGFERLKQVFVQQGASFLDRPQVFTVTHIGQGKGQEGWECKTI